MNFHLMAILHEFVIAAPFVEDRRAQKELQEVAQKLIDANVNVASSRLSHSRWTLRRNFEVLPMNSTVHSPVNDFARVSPVYMERSGSADQNTDTEQTTVEQNIALKRNIFRSSVSVSFPERRFNTPPTYVDTQSENIDYSHYSTDTSSINSEGLWSGLFSFGSFSSTTTTGTGDIASNCQHMFYSYFCIKALYALSEVFLICIL